MDLLGLQRLTSDFPVCVCPLPITNTVFLPLPVGVSDFECSLTNKPKPSKLTPSLPLEPSDHVDQGQRCLHQKKVRHFQLLRAGPVKVRHKLS